MTGLKIAVVTQPGEDELGQNEERNPLRANEYDRLPFHIRRAPPSDAPDAEDQHAGAISEGVIEGGIPKAALDGVEDVSLPLRPLRDIAAGRVNRLRDVVGEGMRLTRPTLHRKFLRMTALPVVEHDAEEDEG